MTVYIARHCELAKQSRCTSGFWIASQARNDVKQARNDVKQARNDVKQAHNDDMKNFYCKIFANNFFL